MVPTLSPEEHPRLLATMMMRLHSRQPSVAAETNSYGSIGIYMDLIELPAASLLMAGVVRSQMPSLDQAMDVYIVCGAGTLTIKGRISEHTCNEEPVHCFMDLRYSS